MRLIVLIVLLFVTVARSRAIAEQSPVAGQEDSRMRYVVYDPNQVVHLTTAVGAAMVVTFASDETVTAVAVTDSKDLTAMPRGNYLFFKSKSALPLQPVIVLTKTDDGVRRYVFSITTARMDALSAGQPNLYYSVQFTYPEQEAAARQKAAAEQAAAAKAARQARLANWRLHQAHNMLEAGARNPFSGKKNWHYIAQGDRSIGPLEVFDNGFSTVFRFPGNVRIPSIFVINPDGREATANYSVKDDLVQVDTVARGWRLRDGQTVLAIWNQVFDAVGDRPHTGTTSPNVSREIRDTAP